MSKELVISANRHETKVAILEDDQLVEIYFQRSNEYSLAGSVHKGRVTRVLPGMQSAFVDLGLERDTFLYVSDFFEESGEDVDRVAPQGGREERSREDRHRGERGDRGDRERERPRQETPAIAAPEEGSPAEAAGPESSAAAPAERVGGPDRTADRSAEDGDGRDRRNRRSRRRRNRGRGFPDSKYASNVRPSVSEPESRQDEPAISQESSGEDFLVLPGESVAKYSRSESGRDVAEPEEETLEESRVEELPEDELDELDSAEEVVDEPIALAPIADVEEVQAAAEEAVAEEAAHAHPAKGFSATHSPEPPAAEEAAEPDAPEDLEGSEDEEEPSEVEGEDGAEAEGDAEAHAEPAKLEGAEAGAGAEPALASRTEVEGGAAQVRDQGGRYLQHRVSRRSRRRQRGGRPQEDRRPEDRSQASPQEEPRRSEPAIARTETSTVSRPDRGVPSITELLKEGQEIIVQIAKEPLGQKGARITSHIALPGRYVVYMPTVEHTGVSRKIASDEERQRLKKILQTHRAGAPGGFILRTAGEGHTEEEIAADMNFLFNLWLDMREKAEKNPAPVLLHHDLDIVQRILRDQLTDSFKSIWVDNEDVYESVLRFVQRFQPALVGRVKLFTRPEPIFDAFNISAELEKALRPKVWLKSGGYIVINQTEALVAIDVNTGKYVGKSNRLEDTIVKTNTEAVKEIVRQIRLRDLGGIIVVDFIDMDERKNRQKVMQVLEEAMRVDRAPYKILQFNDFGLVAITRKRVKQSLERALCAPCPYCEGAGYVKSVTTTVSEILQEAHKIRKAVEDSKDVILRVHPEVAKTLKSHNNRYLEEIEEALGKPVMIKSDLALHQEKFDLA